MSDLTTLFCSVDDFWKDFEAHWNKSLLGKAKPATGPHPELSPSEMMTIVILFHQSNFRTFKHFYSFVCQHLRKEFPKLISYNRFVHIKKQLFVPLFMYLLHKRGAVTGISFVDATSIRVCHNKRIRRNRVFSGLARRGKTTAGWFYGFKLHLIVNDRGEILSFLLTPGNVADVSVLEKLTRGIFGKLFGDKGYISAKVAKRLFKQGVHLFTTLRSNMKQKLMSMQDKILLRKRSIIETINDQLKNISQIEHTRHRAVENFLVNLLAALAAYSNQPKKPSLNIDKHLIYNT